MPPIMNPKTNEFEHGVNGKAHVLKEKLLDVSINPHIQIPSEPYPEPDGWEPLTEEEFERELKRYSTDTAPGQSKITYTVLRWLNDAEPGILLRLYSNCIENGYHPTAFKTANIAIVPKPNKPSYMVAKAYRPIALLECASKLLEKIVTRRLNHYINVGELFPNSQFAGRTKTCVDDAALCLKHDIQTAWNQKLDVSVLFFDISGYFNNIHHKLLIDRMKRLKIPGQICQWIESYLNNRTVTMIIDGVSSAEMTLKDVGVPQGSPLSPTLSSIYTAPLLQYFNSNAFIMPEISPVPIDAVMYIDDGSLRVVSTSIEANIKMLTKSYQFVHNWMTQSNLTLDAEKRDLIHFPY